MFDWFAPQIIEKRQSTFNGNIEVVKFMGKISVRAGGYQQSGPLVERVWRKALDSINVLIPGNKILILGLGCGVVARLVAEKWPGVKIVGVEIDPEMVKLGQKYFGLYRIPNLEIVIKDAFQFIDKSKLKKDEFDVIIIEIYRGKELPKKFTRFSFLDNCRKRVGKEGLAIVNILDFDGSLGKAGFIDRLADKYRAPVLDVDFNRFLLIKP